MMNTSLEKVFANSYLKPVVRTKVGQYSVYVADGFVPEEQIDNFNAAFPITLTEPGYATIWMAEVGPGRLYGGTLGAEASRMAAAGGMGHSQQDRVKVCLEYAARDLKKIKVH